MTLFKRKISKIVVVVCLALLLNSYLPFISDSPLGLVWMLSSAVLTVVGSMLSLILISVLTLVFIENPRFFRARIDARSRLFLDSDSDTKRFAILLATFWLDPEVPDAKRLAPIDDRRVSRRRIRRHRHREHRGE